MTGTYDAERHIYYDDAGREVPSVTKILRFVTRAYMDTDAADRGTFIHEATALDDQDDLYWEGVPEELLGYLHAWRAFLEQEQFTVSVPQIERRTDHPRWRYAGRIDRLGILGDDPALIDIKTGQPEDWHALQSAAYADALEAEGEFVPVRGCVYLAVDGTFKLVRHDGDRSADFRTFLHCLGLHNWEERNKNARRKPHPR